MARRALSPRFSGVTHATSYFASTCSANASSKAPAEGCEVVGQKRPQVLDLGLRQIARAVGDYLNLGISHHSSLTGRANTRYPVWATMRSSGRSRAGTVL